ncbi:MAG: hypothetical protein IKA10_08095 [Oscillospiraceae bacterium]|nr:hypothetical protein [Oscillospiraceae bacterium]
MSIINYFKGKTDDGKDKMSMIHYWGLPGFPFKFPCNMIINPEKSALEFSDIIDKEKPSVLLPFYKITGVGLVSSKEIEAQRMSGINYRGDLLIDAAVKVLRNLDYKERKKCGYLYIVNYWHNDTIASIILRENGNLNYSKFHKILKQYIQERKISKEDIIL